jgi:TonB family protein
VSISGMKRWVALTMLTIAMLGVGASSAMAAERKIKSEVKPSYPELAKRMNVGGAVKIEVVIAPNGTVKSAKALGGHPLLIEPSLDAAKKTKFEPAAEESTQVIVFNFSKPE